MTKAEEILNKHLVKVLQKNYVERNGTAYKACLEAVNEALSLSSVVNWLPMGEETTEIYKELAKEKNLLLLFDDGQICNYEDDWPFSIVTHFAKKHQS